MSHQKLHLQKTGNDTYASISMWMLSLLYFLNVGTLSAQNYSYLRYSTENGLPTNYVYGVVEDNEGYIWAYTETGIAKFDGYEWHTIDSSNGLPGNDVVRLDRTDRGLVGMCYQSNVFDIVDGSIYPIKDSYGYNLSGEERYVIKRDNSKLIYDDTSQGYKTSENYGPETIFQKDNISIHRSQGSFQYEVEGKTVFDLPINVSTVYEYVSWRSLKDSFFCLLHLDNIYQFNIKTHEVITKSSDELGFEDSKFIFGGQVDDHLLIYTDKGILTLDQHLNVTEKYETADLKEKYDLLRPYKDSDGNIWIGTRSSGVIMIPKAMQSIINLKKLKSPIEGIEEAWGDAIYAMTDDAQLYEIAGDTLQKKLKLKKVSRFKSLNFINENEGFLSVGNYGISRLISKDFSITSQQLVNDNPNGPKAWHHIYDPRNSCHYHLGAYISMICNSEKLVPNTPLSIIEAYSMSDHKVGISFITDKTLWSIWDKKTIKVDTIPSFLDPSSIHHLSDDSYLIGTGAYGLYHYSKQDRKYNQILSAPQIKVIKEIDNLLYLTTYNGIYILNQKLEVLHHITTKSGLASNEVHDLLIRNDTIYATTSMQVSIIPFKNLQTPKFDRSVSIDKVIVDGMSYALDSFDGSHINDNIEFHYSLLHYPSNRDITYEYRMKPISNEWTQTKSRSTVFWGLEPDDYQFEVRAIDTYGNLYNGSQHIDISIPTPWHKNPIIWISAFLGLAYLLYQVFRQREITNRKLAKAEAKQTKRIAELELAGLRSQMNPHFVFNAFGAIQYYIQTHKVDEADSYLTSFALLMRRYLESSRNKLISVRDEMDLLTLYTELEAMRFEHQFSVSIDVDQKHTSDLMLPTMLVQPFVENAVLHGLPKREDGKAKLEIIFRSIDKGLEVSIADNGIGKEKASKFKKSHHKSQGLSIINEKISTIQKMGNMTVDIQSSELSADSDHPGTLITITILYL